MLPSVTPRRRENVVGRPPTPTFTLVFSLWFSRRRSRLGRRLDEIPGVGRLGVQLTLAEIGADMTQFPTAAHLV